MKEFLASLKMILALTLLTGVFYPLFITGFSHLFMAKQAEGSLFIVKGKVIGSRLIGQKFESNIYFWPRPSACNYNGAASQASNLGPTSALLKETIEERKSHLIASHGLGEQLQVPADLLFSSGSGLDPHISLQAALFQIERVSSARNYSDEQKAYLIKLVLSLATRPSLGCMGEPYVNVLELNASMEDFHVR